MIIFLQLIDLPAFFTAFKAYNAAALMNGQPYEMLQQHIQKNEPLQLQKKTSSYKIMKPYTYMFRMPYLDKSIYLKGFHT